MVHQQKKQFKVAYVFFSTMSLFLQNIVSCIVPMFLVTFQTLYVSTTDNRLCCWSFIIIFSSVLRLCHLCGEDNITSEGLHIRHILVCYGHWTMRIFQLATCNVTNNVKSSSTYKHNYENGLILKYFVSLNFCLCVFVPLENCSRSWRHRH